jgi:hypothetical protein
MKMLIKIITLLLASGFLFMNSCRLFEGREKEAEKQSASAVSSADEEMKKTTKEADNAASASAEEKEDKTAERSSLIPEEDKSEEIYALLPHRSADFLQVLKEKMENHEWQWIIKRAEDPRYRPALDADTQTQASYVYALLGFGRVIRSDSDVWIEDVEPVYPQDIVRLEYTAAEKIFLSHLVEAVVYNASGARFPLLFEILSELDTILIAEPH